jgi:hypothetical protein
MFYSSPKFIIVLTKAHHWTPFWIRLISIQIFTPYIYKKNSNIILSLMPVFKVISCFGIFRLKCMQFSSLPYKTTGSSLSVFNTCYSLIPYVPSVWNNRIFHYILLSDRETKFSIKTTGSSQWLVYMNPWRESNSLFYERLIIEFSRYSI